MIKLRFSSRVLLSLHLATSILLALNLFALASTFPSATFAAQTASRAAEFFGDEFSAAEFDELETPNFRVMSPEQCLAEEELRGQETPLTEAQLRSAIESGLGQEVKGPGLLQWVPTGIRDVVIPPQCMADAIEERLIATRGRPEAVAEELRSFFSMCQGYHTRYTPRTWESLVQLTTSHYDFCRHPRIRKVLIRASDGQWLRGFLALKPKPRSNSEKRPLIVVKCGVFCNAGDTSHRTNMMLLYDEGPFNVLAIANATGTDYVRDNGHLALGGFDEGMQLMRIIKEIHASPLGRRSSRVHVAAVSLGSHSALFASVLNRHHLLSDGRPPISSTLAMCPVVELQPTMQRLFDPTLRGRVARWFLLRQIIRVLSTVPLLGEILRSLQNAATADIPDRVAEGAVEHYRTLGPDWAIAPFTGQSIRSREELWERNSFLRLADQPLVTPTIAIAAADDWIVDTDINARALERRVGRWPGDQRVQVVNLDRGNHCAFATVQGWDIAGAVLRGYFVSQSPELARRKRFDFAPLLPDRLSYRMSLWQPDKHMLQSFEAVPGRDWFRMTFRIWDGWAQSGGCQILDPYAEPPVANTHHDGKSHCLRIESARIPWSDLGAKWPWPVPRTADEAARLTRWMNANLRVTDSRGRPLTESREAPAYFKWMTYSED